MESEDVKIKEASCTYEQSGYLQQLDVGRVVETNVEALEIWFEHCLDNINKQVRKELRGNSHEALFLGALSLLERQ